MSFFPYVKGKSVRIKQYVVRETQFGFLVFDTKNHKEITKTFCKTSALALAKSLAKNAKNADKIKELDQIIQKNYTDAVFFRNTIEVNPDTERRFVARDRYDIAAARTRSAKEQLDRIIYS